MGFESGLAKEWPLPLNSVDCAVQTFLSVHVVLLVPGLAACETGSAATDFVVRMDWWASNLSFEALVKAPALLVPFWVPWVLLRPDWFSSHSDRLVDTSEHHEDSGC